MRGWMDLICLLGFNVAFKHLRSYRDGSLTNVRSNSNVMPQTQDMTPNHVKYIAVGTGGGEFSPYFANPKNLS